MQALGRAAIAVRDGRGAAALSGPSAADEVLCSRCCSCSLLLLLLLLLLMLLLLLLLLLVVVLLLLVLLLLVLLVLLPPLPRSWSCFMGLNRSVVMRAGASTKGS
jgi:hypothetical protein